MHLTTPEGAHGWQCRAASLPAVTASLSSSHLTFLSFNYPPNLPSNFLSDCLFLDLYKLSFLVGCLLFFVGVSLSASLGFSAFTIKFKSKNVPVEESGLVNTGKKTFRRKYDMKINKQSNNNWIRNGIIIKNLCSRSQNELNKALKMITIKLKVKQFLNNFLNY